MPIHTAEDLQYHAQMHSWVRLMSMPNLSMCSDISILENAVLSISFGGDAIATIVESSHWWLGDIR
jgi:hypothetical protein